MRRHAKAIVVSALLLILALGVTAASAAAPTVTVDPIATSVSYTTAHVSGTIDAQGQETNYYFQHSTDPDTEGWNSGFLGGPVPLGGPQKVEQDLEGLKAGTKYFFRLIAYNGDGETISEPPYPSLTTEAVTAPSASIDPVTNVTGTTAHFSGIVNPEAAVGSPAAFDVDWHFECTPECPSLSGGHIAADSSNHAVSAEANGLSPNTNYEVKLVASNAGEQAIGGPIMFKTTQVAPEVQTLYPGSVTTDSAILAASVNPRNDSVAYQFEWGTDESYGNAVPVIPQALGVEDNAFHTVTTPLSGLQPGTTYHFRIVATNSGTSEVVEGVDHVFTTALTPSLPLPGLADGRVYERVSPVEKAGADLQNDSVADAVARASSDGGAVAYFALTTFAGDSSPFHTQYLSRRASGGGWTTKGISPRVDANRLLTAGPTLWVSPNLRHSIPITRIEGRANGLYLRDTLTDQMTWLMEPAPGIPGPTHLEDTRFAGASKDLDHVVFTSTNRLLPETIDGEFEYYQIYDWFDGAPHLASILPDGTPVATDYTWVGGRKDSSSHPGYPGDYAVSEDGNRIFFMTPPGRGEGESFSRLYLRENHSQTIEVSVSERGACPAAPGCDRPGEFQFANSDGSVAFFNSTDLLTDDASACCDLYRWDRAAPAGERLTDVTAAAGTFIGTAGSSKDATRVYFSDTGVLAAGAREGEPNLYLWQEGVGIRFIATLASSDGVTGTDRIRYDESDSYKDARVTPNGSYLLFASRARLTSFDTNGQRQIYRYDAVRDELTCVSCNPRTEDSNGEAVFGSHTLIKASGGLPAKMPAPPLWLTRNISDDGQVVFFDTREALVPTDSNGKVDAYQWKDGQVSLLSSGNSATDSYFLDASSSGDDAFFTTREPLVQSDRDTVIDVYDARVNGVPEPPVTQPCVGDDCQSTPSSPPAYQTPGSSTFSGASNPASKKAKSKKKKHKQRRHGSRQGRGSHRNSRGQS